MRAATRPPTTSRIAVGRASRKGGQRPSLLFATGPMLARFLLVWCAGIVILVAFPSIDAAAIGGTISMASGVLQLLGIQHSVEGARLVVGGSGMLIIADCTPTQAILMLGAAMLASPAAWRARCVGLALGSTLLTGFNLARVLILLFVAKLWPDAFEFVHIYVWQSATFLVLCVIVVVWLRWVRQTGSVEAP